jgi:hypothetical protein
MWAASTKQISDLQQDKEAVEQQLNNKIKFEIPNVRVIKIDVLFLK